MLTTVIPFCLISTQKIAPSKNNTSTSRINTSLRGSTFEDVPATTKNDYFFGAILNGFIALGGTTTSLLFLGFLTSLLPLI